MRHARRRTRPNAVQKTQRQQVSQEASGESSEPISVTHGRGTIQSEVTPEFSLDAKPDFRLDAKPDIRPDAKLDVKPDDQSDRVAHIFSMTGLETQETQETQEIQEIQEGGDDE